MPKLTYYTCPLKAAYMAKEFGVEYSYCPGAFSYSFRNNDLAQYKEKYYIHAESMAVLKPKEKDLVEIGGQLETVERLFINAHGERMLWAEDEHYTPGDVDKIIQREGKQFFWPTFEEVGDE